MQRRRLGGDDHDDEVDVGGDRAPPLRHVRVGACEQAAAGQHRGDAVTLALPLEEHVVADGEVALLPAGEVARQDRRDLDSVEQRRADAGGDAGDDAACVAGGRGGPAPASAWAPSLGPSSSPGPTSSSRKSSSSSFGPPGFCVRSAALRSLAARL